MKIAIDCIFFQFYQTGIARVWRSLLEEWLKGDFWEYIIILDRAGTAPKFPQYNYLVIQPYSYQDTESDREMLQSICDEQGIDIFISTYYTTPLTTPSIFMGYDMIPEVLGGDLSEPMWREKHYAIQHAAAYITISENTARDLVKCFPEIDPDRVTVAHCGVASLFQPGTSQEIESFKRKYGISLPYFILAAPGTGYKNAQLFFQALGKLPSRLGFALVCTGNHGILEEQLRAYVPGTIIYTLPLKDEELRLAYTGAIALVYPSRYEGFGLPVLEALACGCPVITTPKGSLPEVAGTAALYVSDNDVDELTEALCDIQKPRVYQSLIVAGLQQARRFSWEKMARIVAGVLVEKSLLHFNLQSHNLIIFPDWEGGEEALSHELKLVCESLSLATHLLPLTLLVDAGKIGSESANLILSGVIMNLMLEEGLNLPEGLEIVVIGALIKRQWEELSKHLKGRVVLTRENKEAIVRMGFECLPVYALDRNPP